jgi:hypothetical protein
MPLVVVNIGPKTSVAKTTTDNTLTTNILFIIIINKALHDSYRYVNHVNRFGLHFFAT